MPHYAGVDGFLGTRASLMLDLFVVIMAVVVAALGWSVYEVKYRRRFGLHRYIQVFLGLALLAAVVVFELDIRLNGWRDRAAGAIGGEVPAGVWVALAVHLVFAISTVLLWPVVIVAALRGFGNPPVPGPHSRWHKPWARVAALDLVATAITGWIFYLVAFVG